MKKFGVTILFCFSLSSLILFYQNCGGQGASNSLCFGGNCSQKDPSQGCPNGTNFVAATQSCQTCQYGYNSATQSCSSFNPPGAAPQYSCAAYPVGSQSPDNSRNCTTGCTLNQGETLKCQSKSFVLAPNDFLYGCQENTPQCTNLLGSDWTKSTVVEGSFTFSVYNYSYVNNHQGTDVQQNTIIRDAQNALSPPAKVLIRGPASSGGGSYSQTLTLTCSAGNNEVRSVTQPLSLPGGTNPADLRITQATVITWTNGGFNAGSTYTNPPIFLASFNGSNLTFQCNQATATVTFSVASNQGGNTTWQITQRSQLP